MRKGLAVELPFPHERSASGRQALQFGQEEHRLLARVPAHLARRRQAAADPGPARLPETSGSAKSINQRFPRDRWRDATRATIGGDNS
jgi:hypothetical protein